MPLGDPDRLRHRLLDLQRDAASLFGRVHRADAGRLEVLCTNPAALRGGTGSLDTYQATSVFPGTIGAPIHIMEPSLPAASTPWISFPGAYRARCSHAGGASVLLVHGRPGAIALAPSPDPTWGLHLADMTLPLGKLVSLVRTQVAAYLRGR